MNLYDVIVIGGAPGVGKSTLMRKLQKHFSYSPTIEFSDVRNLYLDPKWDRAAPDEERMAFEILKYALGKILRKNAKPVLMTDFTDERLASFHRLLKGKRYKIVTLYADNERVIRDRIRARNAGFGNLPKAIRWNNRVKTRRPLVCESKIKIDNLSKSAVLQRCLEVLAPTSGRSRA